MGLYVLLIHIVHHENLALAATDNLLYGDAHSQLAIGYRQKSLMAEWLGHASRPVT